MAKRMRGLYKRGNVWWCCYKSASGVILRETTKQTDHKEAMEFLMKRLGEVAQGEAPELRKIGNHTFGELVEEYLKWAERQKSFHGKQRMIGQLKAEFGHLHLRNFSTLMLEQFQTKRLRAGIRLYKVNRGDGIEEETRGNKEATVNRLLATIKHMFTKAVEWGMVEETIGKRVHKVKLLKEKNKRLRFLSKEECQELLSECSDVVKPIVITALNTGMRRGEILGLKWANVDLKHGFILLEDGMVKNDERREIPINQNLRAALQSVTRRLDVPYVFHDPETGNRYRDVKKGFNAACRRARITDFHFHDLRHTFASHLVMEGVDLKTVQELLGHKTLQMTLRYSHLASSHKAKAVDVLDNALGIQNSTSQLLHNLGFLEK